jgi:hypothetical protein
MGHQCTLKTLGWAKIRGLGQGYRQMETLILRMSLLVSFTHDKAQGEQYHEPKHR